MKEYFSHDLHSRNDRKISKLFKELKLSGIGAYWCIVEMLHEENGYIPVKEIENIAYELRVKPEFILRILNDFELFSIGKIQKAFNESEFFWSESALLQIEKKNLKSVKARKSVSNRWDKHTNVLQTYYDHNANALQSQSYSNTIKEKTVYEDETNLIASCRNCNRRKSNNPASNLINNTNL